MKLAEPWLKVCAAANSAVRRPTPLTSRRTPDARAGYPHRHWLLGPNGCVQRLRADPAAEGAVLLTEPSQCSVEVQWPEVGPQRVQHEDIGCARVGQGSIRAACCCARSRFESHTAAWRPTRSWCCSRQRALFGRHPKRWMRSLLPLSSGRPIRLPISASSGSCTTA